MVPFGGWEMPLAYPTGTIDEHLACRNDAVVFDVSHLGTVRVEGADAAERLQRAFTNDLRKIAPGRAQYTHLLDEVDASVLDDIIVWWVDDEVFDVMPNASNTDRVRAAIGGNETTHDGPCSPCRAHAPRSAWRRCSPMLRPSVGSASAALDVGGHRLRRGRHRLHGRGRRRDRRAQRRGARSVGRSHRCWRHAGRARRARHAAARGRAAAARPRAGPRHHAAAGGLGWVVAWSKDEFRGREPLAAERSAVSAAG